MLLLNHSWQVTFDDLNSRKYIITSVIFYANISNNSRLPGTARLIGALSHSIGVNDVE